ncbi:adhesion G protein-coupled receptor E5-like [Myotis daubentonii]|uniref:adhesion G protein-coupled receptor E5-like n=1 Tax=Myotis daubentonii TaxID=98922 RepID=UPI002873E774|nr:adhesion G protein-coupled receptor E5-like [Myotis daubentonii]
MTRNHADQTMGAPRLSAFHILQVLCVLLTLLEDGPQNTRASACPQQCPPDSSCINGTACHCDPGFQTPFGKNKVNQGETCEDIDECKQRVNVTCGEDARCHNTKGSYYCTCRPGYRPGSGATKFNNPSENTCQDVDDCKPGQNSCHKSTQCHNTEGSYDCLCHPGWKPVPGSPHGLHNTVCEQGLELRSHIPKDTQLKSPDHIFMGSHTNPVQ